jgi:glycosyltransferase involved in cell wall biosynthesis
VKFPRISYLFGAYNRLFGPLLRAAAKYPYFSPLIQHIERIWYLFQGPYCPNLVAHLGATAQKFDAVIFFTYLYYPTAVGILTTAKNSILVPTAHDEQPFYFHSTCKAFAAAQAVLANTDAELKLITSVYPGVGDKISIAGTGVDLFSDSEIAEFRKSPVFGLKPDSYVLYLGRISRGKGVDSLITCFMEYLNDNPASRLELILAGEVSDVQIPKHPSIRWVGKVSDSEKRSLLANSLCIANPSPMESLSLLVLEALAMKRPVVANRRCPVFQDYAARVQSLRLFDGPAEFGGLLNGLEAGMWPGAEDRDQGRSYVQRKFSWEAVLKTYELTVAAIVKSRSK